MAVSIYTLPGELLTIIAEWLDLHDLCSLGFTSRYLHGVIMYNESVAKRALESYMPSALETHEARTGSSSYARGLRRCIKRLLGISNAEPFQVAIVAMADNFIYSSGMLCYSTSRRHTRLRDLHRSSTHEVEIDTRALLDQALPESGGKTKYSFWPAYYSEGVLSCTYQHTEGFTQVTYLVVVNPHRQEVMSSRRIHMPCGKPVIRNTKDRLLLVEKNETWGHTRYEWVVQNLDLRTKEWATVGINLHGITGAVINKTVCFDIIGDYFYAVCSEPHRYTPDTIDWTSFYLVKRFLLSDMTQSDQVELWRRKHEEGPINDAWTTLKLEEDPFTGSLTIVEVRMEWLRGETPSVRTCYRTQVVFPNKQDSAEAAEALNPPSLLSGNTAHPPTTGVHLAQQLPRSPQSMHHDGAEHTFPLPSSTFIRSYQQIGSTFVDLRSYRESDGSQRLYLQSISRRNPGTPNTIKTWPPKATAGRDTSELSELLSPKGFYKTPSAEMDDRVAVYGLKGDRTKRHGDLFPIVMASFDPAFRIAGRRWPSRAPLSCPDSLTEPLPSFETTSGDANGHGAEEGVSWARIARASDHQLSDLPSALNLASSPAAPEMELQVGLQS